MTLAELNEKYYYLFNDLFDASPALPERHYNTVARVLEQQYLEELDICLLETALDVGEKNFELKFRAKNYLPKRVWLRWNKMAKVLLKDFRTEFKTFLDNWEISKQNQHKPTVVPSDELPTKESTDLPVAPFKEVEVTKEPNDEKAVTPEEEK